MTGLKPDDSVETNLGAEFILYEHYPGIVAVECRGVSMVGFPADDSWELVGSERFWDKNFCAGRVRDGATFTLIHDGKENRDVNYRLRGVSISELLGEPGPPTPPHPVRLTGLVPDGQGEATGYAEGRLYFFFAGIASVRCRGIVMVGRESRSLDGPQAWDKLLCAGRTHDDAAFSLIFDPKQNFNFRIYRVKGVSIHELEGLPRG